jgi:hypothetical protein
MASGCVRKNAGSFQTFVISSSRSSGVGGPVSVEMRCPVAVLAIRPVVRVVDQLALLALLDRLDGQPELLGDLVVRAAVKVGDPGVDVDDGRDRAEEVLARRLVVADVGLRQLGLVAGRAGDLDVLRMHDPVQSVDASFDRYPLQQPGQPPRRDRIQLGGGLGGVRQLACCSVAERERDLLIRWHFRALSLVSRPGSSRRGVRGCARHGSRRTGGVMTRPGRVYLAFAPHHAVTRG